MQKKVLGALLLTLVGSPLILGGCKADRGSDSNNLELPADNGENGQNGQNGQNGDNGGDGAPDVTRIQAVPAPGEVTHADVVLHRITPDANGALDQVASANTAADGVAELESDDGLPQLAVIDAQLTDQSQLYDGGTQSHRQAGAAGAGIRMRTVVSGYEHGEALALTPFTEIAHGLAERHGLNRLDADQADAYNEAVRNALTPALQDLLAEPHRFRSEPEAESLGTSDADLQALYGIALAQLGAQPGVEPAEDLPQVLRALEQLREDARAGTIDGRDAHGAPIAELAYNPLRFIARYDTAVRATAGSYGDDELNALVQDTASARFISRDPQCGDEFIDEYFASHANVLELPVREVDGYDGHFTEGETYSFSLNADGSVAFSTDQADLTVARSGVFTCTAGSSNGQDTSLVRYLIDFSDDGQPEEFVIVGTGTGGDPASGDASGIYLADESGDRLVVFGDVSPSGGWEKDDDPSAPDPDAMLACGVENYLPFAGDGENTSAEGITSGLLDLSSVNNPEWAIDGDVSSAATISVPLSLLGLVGGAELIVRNETPPMTEAPQHLGVVVSVSDALLSAGLLDDMIVETYEHGTLRDRESGAALLRLDLLGLLNDENARMLEIPTSSTFDEVRIRLGEGLLSLGTNISIHEVCYEP